MTDKSTENLRVLRISHSAVSSASRERERSLVSNFPVELMLIMPRYWPEAGSDHNDTLSEPFKVERINTIGTGSVPLFAFDPFPLIKVLCKFKPHIVDIHEEPYSVSGFECAWLTKCFAPDAACIFYTAQNILKRYPPPFCWSERFVYGHCQAAYPCSKGAQETLRQKGFNKPAPVIPLGVDPALFRRGQTTDNERAEKRKALGLSEFVVGFMGRIEEYKGIAVLLKALTKIPNSINWSLLVVGSGDFQPMAQRIAKQLKITEKIYWLGEQPSSEIPLLMSLCDVIVIPSLTTSSWQEQFGRVAAEAMACEIPVISSDSGSLPEVTGGAVLSVPEGNSQAITEKLASLHQDANLRAELSARGIQLARSSYTWDSIAERMFNLYKTTYGSAKGGTSPKTNRYLFT